MTSLVFTRIYSYFHGFTRIYSYLLVAILSVVGKIVLNRCTAAGLDSFM